MKLVTVSFCVFINLWPRPWPRPRDDWPRPRSLWPRPHSFWPRPRPWPHELMASLTSLSIVVTSNLLNGAFGLSCTTTVVGVPKMSH